MFPLDAPPDTSGYMIAGYAVFFVVAILYLASLFVRWRNTNQDLTALETIEKENQPKAKARKDSKPGKPKANHRKK